MQAMIEVDASPRATVAGGGLQVRQARLKPEYSVHYPSLTAGVWEPAVTLADRLLAESLLHGHATALWGRTLVNAHFQFRGGSSRGGERVGMRSRREATT
jgi:hypothetical protein